MTSDRSASPLGARRGRVVALTAGATLGLGALVALPPVTAGPGATDLTGTVALTAADAAAPAVTLGTTSVRAGGEVPFTATGFPAGGRLSVKLDDAALLAQFTVGDDGSVSDRVTVPAGTSAGDGHWLRFLATGTSVRSESLTVTAAPSASPTPAPTPKPTPSPSGTTAPAAEPKVRLTGGREVAAGGRVSFALSGFVKGQNITVKLDDSEILGQWAGAVKADGTFSGTVTVPASASAGAHWLRVLAPDPATSLKADLTVTAASPGGGSGGSGGSAGSGGSGSGSGASGSTGSSGASGSSDTAAGSSSGTSAAITGGSRVAAGGTVSFRVTGFPAGRQLTVKLDDSEILGQWTVGPDGSYAGSVTVPPDAARGAHWLRFLAPDPPTSLRAGFTVTSGAAASSGTGGGSASGAAGGAATPVPAASGAPASATNDAGAKAEITASEVQPGGTLHFEVTRFPAGEQVTVKLDDEAILGQWKTDGDGSYEGDVTVPADTTAGPHWLRFLAPDPPTSLKVEFTVNAAAAAGAGTGTSSTTAPDTSAKALLAASGPAVSHATIAWSAAAAAAGGAAGAAATTLLVVRRRTGRPAHGA
ncbi:hypothetical protein [Streptomyces daghestanicus]|uniref:Uncharacterized protein n=1 Tax=Streptomyces daghestanicus TaxID=66885 RepID=A0ABQ3PYV1_9ACTN|nr:hypothetical protein [Streptomyces daghestanicus]GGU65465.1 hypothetical protein GCM10010259_64780 [Streptomyces daghestanicus]GHI29585.1 hypothetical protein Sdagh_13150 [Streptomyces daghestanicus]GHI29587.1 hypothetical protein Sdagh_13170 [Streptomyces daghestanicus]GHI30184.1 hypothetical protein Sdagh_19140 [Streptomyces daghestanicus]